MTRIQCNVCGKDTTSREVHIAIEIHKPIGYGSRYDGDKIDLDVFTNCVDSILDAISKVCLVYQIHIINDNYFEIE